MTFPSSISKTCTHVGNSSVPTSVTDRKIERGGLPYGILPREVTTDVRLKHVDVRIYGVLATCRKGSRVKIGMRLIAKSACTSLGKIGPALKRLSDCGHIEIIRHSFRKRSEYRITYYRFNEEKAETCTPKSGKADSDLLSCPRCHSKCRQLLRTGWCRSCAWNDKIRGVVREEIARSA